MKKLAAEFETGRENVEDDGWPGFPKYVDKRRDRQSIASEVGISFEAVHPILTNVFGMSKVSARWVQQMLTDDQEMDYFYF